LATLIFNKLDMIKLHFFCVGVDRPNVIGENLEMDIAENNGYSVKQAVASWYAQGLKYDYTNEISNPATGEEQLLNEHKCIKLSYFLFCADTKFIEKECFRHTNNIFFKLGVYSKVS